MAFVVLPGIVIVEKLILTTFITEKLVVAAAACVAAKATVETVKVAVELTGKVVCAAAEVASDATKGSNERRKETIGDGKPTKEAGFEPKRNSEGKKVVGPNGKRGYEHKNGDIWVPVKESNHEGAHRGEHWDVQHPREKTYHNTLPDGKIAGGNCRHVKK